jgi:prolyl-tRNA synthetase
MSELFLRTLRDDPAEAEIASHKLLIRAGYVRPIAPGLYSWLPLGLRVLRKIERVVREEMNAIGGQEILFPALLPRAPYETTNRWTEYGDGIFRLKDRRDNDYLLAPTHEEVFTLTVKGEYSSYKDFPLTLYQIQTKYRDEARPRAGILRGREFVMKDSYSYDIDDAGLKNAYHAHREAYQRIFRRLDIDYVIVSAVAWNPVTPPTSRLWSPRGRKRGPSTDCPRRWSTTPATPRPSRPWSSGPTGRVWAAVSPLPTP